MYGLCTWNMVETNPLKSMVGPAWRSILDTSLILLLQNNGFLNSFIHLKLVTFEVPGIDL